MARGKGFFGMNPQTHPPKKVNPLRGGDTKPTDPGSRMAGLPEQDSALWEKKGG
jgi:hypothetical protein